MIRCYGIVRGRMMDQELRRVIILVVELVIMALVCILLLAYMFDLLGPII